MLIVYCNVERRLKERIETTASKHGASLGKLISSFNKLCDEINTLIRKRSAPHHAVAPQHLNRESVLSLDVDDPIWNDCGLGDDDSEVPLWLRSDEVREGISALLTLRRCEEEERYLSREGFFLQNWYRQEWERLTHAIPQSTGQFDFEYSKFFH